MARFLLTFLHTPSNEVPLFVKAFRIKNATSPDEVSVPENTLMFAFVKADVESPEELSSSFITFKPGTHAFMTSTVDISVENDKFFIIGEQVCIDGIDMIHNPKLHTYLPVQFLNDNYEVVDM